MTYIQYDASYSRSNKNGLNGYILLVALLVCGLSQSYGYKVSNSAHLHTQHVRTKGPLPSNVIGGHEEVIASV